MTSATSRTFTRQTNKKWAARLALWALGRNLRPNKHRLLGPRVQIDEVDSGKLRLSFDYASGGLASRDGKPLSWFEIIDADEGGFVKADARIDGATVLLSAQDVAHPVAMRFAWSMLAEPNLINSDGLPADAFRAGAVPKRDLLAMKVPEAKDYQLVYDLDVAKLGAAIDYTTDNHAKIDRPFDRVAYFLELQTKQGESKYVYVSMEAFTPELAKIGVPALGAGARWQQNVSSLNVYSNVKGIVTGVGLTGGNVEFWPNNYSAANEAKVPNASGDVYDFGDQPADPADGYGSMQIHNHDARQTLFALNHWREGKAADLGIGNQPAATRTGRSRRMPGLMQRRACAFW